MNEEDKGAQAEHAVVLFQEKMVRRDKELAKGWGQIATPLLIETEDGMPRGIWL